MFTLLSAFKEAALRELTLPRTAVNVPWSALIQAGSVVVFAKPVGKKCHLVCVSLVAGEVGHVLVC